MLFNRHPQSPSDEDLKSAALSALYPLPCVNPGYCDAEELSDCQARTAKLRQWVETDEALSDRRIRAAYMEWVTYCEYQNQRGAEELRLGTRRKAHEEYLAREEAKRQRVDAIVLPQPPRKF